MSVDSAPSFDECAANMQALADYYVSNAANRNEAATRSHLIDTLLYQCLGWAKHDVYPEEPYSEEYTDYTFNAPRKVMILEAKREGEYFTLPVSPSSASSLSYKLKTLCKGNAKLKKAVNQVAGYCQKRGIPLAIVCNGHQVVAFVGSRHDGIPPMDGNCIVFRSLGDMAGNFLAFWNLFSQPAVADKNLEQKLVGQSRPSLPPTVASTIDGYPRRITRNTYQAELQVLIEAVIDDIPQTPEYEERFLRHCYCDGGAISQHSLASKAILRSRYDGLFNDAVAGPTLAAVKSKANYSPDLFNALSSRPILLLGDVGVGKSIFINHLVKVDAKEVLAASIVFYIDLGTKGVLAQDLASFVIDEIRNKLREIHGINIQENGFVRHIYKQSLVDFEKSIYGPLKKANPTQYVSEEIKHLAELLGHKDRHLKLALEYIVKRDSKQVLIFLDNSDQRDDMLQDAAFLIATELAAEWPAMVYLPMRPETFYRSIKVGALSGYHPKAFTVAPPRMARVVERRLDFALGIVEENRNSLTVPDAQVNCNELTIVLRSFKSTVEKSEEVIEFLDNISGGNVRQALGMVKTFFSTGHADMREIVSKFLKDPTYLVPLHHFMRSCIFGDSQDYDSTSPSPFANLFEVYGLDSREHFLLPIALGVFQNEAYQEAERGFVNTDFVYQELQGAGFTVDQIDFSIVRAQRKGLIESPARQLAEVGKSGPKLNRLTTTGYYHLQKLPAMFTYVDAMIATTPILDSDMRAKIKDVSSIRDRLNRAVLFREYLDAQWTTFSKSMSHYFDWEQISARLLADMDFVAASSLRNVKNAR